MARSEEELSNVVAGFLRKEFPSMSVRTEQKLLSPPYVDAVSGNVVWPGPRSGLRGWKQDICIGHEREDAHGGFIPLVSIETKKDGYTTDAMITASTKIRRLKPIYPYLTSLYLYFGKAEKPEPPSRKAFFHLIDFDAHLCLRYSVKDNKYVLNRSDVAVLKKAVDLLLQSARTRYGFLSEEVTGSGWINSTVDASHLK